MKQRDRARITIPVLAVLAAALLGTGPAEGAGYRYEETVTKSIPLEGARKLVIESLSGDIAVTGQKGLERIELKIAKVIGAEDEETARRIAESMGVVVTRPEDAVRIETRYPSKGKVRKSIFSLWFEKGRSMSISLMLTVPADLVVETASASGDVRIERMAAGVRISTASGDLEVRDIDGDVEADVASGDIEVENVSGSVTLGSSAGDIKAENVGGDARIKAASGDTELDSIGGDLVLSTYSGDSEVDGVGGVTYSGISGSARFIGVRGGVEATAASGDLDFRVSPQGSFDYTITSSSGDVTLRFLTVMDGGYILRAETTSGDITAHLPITVTKVSRNLLSGIVREGRAKVSLETSGGDITIEEPEQ